MDGILLSEGTLLLLGREVKEEVTNGAQSAVFLGRLPELLMTGELLYISSFSGTKNDSGCESEFVQYNLMSHRH